jgi:hypothetical protein
MDNAVAPDYRLDGRVCPGYLTGQKPDARQSFDWRDDRLPSAALPLR